MMAMAFHTSMFLPEIFDSEREKRTKVFRVETERRDKHMGVYVTNDYHDYRYRKLVPLTWRWWQVDSPAENIRRTVDKAQKIADKLNHEELYLEHEAALVDRL